MAVSEKWNAIELSTSAFFSFFPQILIMSPLPRHICEWHNLKQSRSTKRAVFDSLISKQKTSTTGRAADPEVVAPHANERSRAPSQGLVHLSSAA